MVNAGPVLYKYEDEAEWVFDKIAITDVGVCAIVAQGGVQLLLYRMNTWVDNQDPFQTCFLQRSCETLARVARTQVGMDAIVQEGGISLVLDLMRVCVLKRIWTSSMVGNISDDGEAETENSERLSQKTKNDIQTAACNLLAKFADRDDASICIIYNAGLSLLKDVQEDSNGDEGVLLAVSKVLPGVREALARVRENHMSFAMQMHREGSLTADIVRKILELLQPPGRTGVTRA